jgi:tight adherence protein B
VIALAVVLSGVAVALQLRPAPMLPSISPHRHRVVGSPASALAVGGLVVVLLLAVLSGRRLVLALILLGCLVGAGEMIRRARQVRAAEQRQGLVVEVCEALMGELRAGQPLVWSLEHCVEVWPEVEPALAAARLGADVPTALRRLARLPGAEAMEQVAAAWQVSHSSGAGLAGVLTQVTASARAVESTRHLIKGELASAQATARLVAALPLASLAMSAGIGGRPWQFLLDTWPGLGCLGLGCATAFAGLVWMDRIASAVLRR